MQVGHQNTIDMYCFCLDTWSQRNITYQQWEHYNMAADRLSDFRLGIGIIIKLFQFVLCGHPTPRCWMSQRRSRVGLFRSRLRTLGTHYHLTLDPAVLWTPSNDTSRPICSDSLNLMPPAPLYLRTLWRYTNAVIIIIIIKAEKEWYGIGRP